MVFGLPEPLPAVLVPQHLVYFLLFAAALYVDLKEECKVKLNRLRLHEKVY